MNFNFSVGPYGLEHLEHMCSSCSKILYFKYFEDEVGKYFITGEGSAIPTIYIDVELENLSWKNKRKNWGGKIITVDSNE